MMRKVMDFFTNSKNMALLALIIICLSGSKYSLLSAVILLSALAIVEAIENRNGKK